MNTLEELAEQVRGCTDCPLNTSRTHAVPGEGPSSADIMFIGEGPGYQEDRQGRPFVGPAGKLLDDLLSTIDLNREDVFIANMVKCRPPSNRDPSPTEIAACSKYLDRQIELVSPKLVVTLGRFSLGKFFPKESISRARGKVRKTAGLNVYPIMHPAAALHRPELKTLIEDDFKALPALVREIENSHKDQTVEMVDEVVESPQPEQLSMF